MPPRKSSISLKKTDNIVILSPSILILFFFLYLISFFKRFAYFFMFFIYQILQFYFKDMNTSNQQESVLRRNFIKCDIFSSTQFFKLKQESSYKTMTGGICTVIFLIAMIILFSLRLYNNLNSNPIVTSNINLYGSGPLSIKTSTQDRSKFMFAIAIQNNEVTVNSYFNVNLNIGKTYVKLKPCDQSQWNINSQISDRLQEISFNQRFLCLPKNTIIQINQKPIIVVTNCTNSNCLGQNNTNILDNNQTLQFSLQILFVNTFINPNDKDPLTYFLDNRNQMYFTLNSGGSIVLPFSQYEIQTSHYQIPLISQNLQRESGVFVDGPGQSIPYRISPQNSYAAVFFRRSIKDVNCKRAYESILEVFSYIGGLASSFLPILTIILNAYNSFVFQVQTSQQIFSIRKEQPKEDQMMISSNNIKNSPHVSNNHHNSYIQYQQTNFLTFIKNTLWCKNKYITRFQEQINAQLDIQNIIKKLCRMQKLYWRIKQKFKEDPNFDLAVLQRKHTIQMNDDNQKKIEIKLNQEKKNMKDNLRRQRQKIMQIEF